MTISKLRDMGSAASSGPSVNTVLGPVSPEDLGVVAIHESLLSVYPGAQFAPEISLDRAEIFTALADKLKDFRDSGGGTVVDSTGMFHGRDLSLYEALSRHSGVHIVASTGLGPERLLGGYFLTPQTNPPTPWPADKFSALFTKEVHDGMVVPRLERRAAAGLVATAADTAGMTLTEESLLRGAARTAQETGVAVYLRYGADALKELDVLLDEGLPARRIVVGGLDRVQSQQEGTLHKIAGIGAYAGLDHVGLNDDAGYVDDRDRARLVLELVASGFGDQVLLSSSAVGVAKGHSPNPTPYSFVLTSFIPFLESQGLKKDDAKRLLISNPRELLSIR